MSRLCLSRHAGITTHVDRELLSADRAIKPETNTSALFPGFSTVDVEVADTTIHAVHGGSGPPVLLLHATHRPT
jgi:hypothetical protein